MGKKMRRSRHRIPAAAFTAAEPTIDPDYQAEIDQSMTRLQTRYRKTQKALQTARARAERAQARAQELADRHAADDVIAANQDDLRRWTAAVIDRLRELRDIEQLMMPGNYVPGRNRGTGQPHQTHGGRR